MKFKVGDRVIVVREIEGQDEHELHWTGTVASIEGISKRYPIVVDIDQKNKQSYGYTVNNLEHLEVFATPLYNALK